MAMAATRAEMSAPQRASVEPVSAQLSTACTEKWEIQAKELMTFMMSMAQFLFC